MGQSILIVFADAGAGHRRVAEAIAARLDDGSRETIMRDLGTDAAVSVIRCASELYSAVTRYNLALRTYDAAWRLTEVPSVDAVVSSAVSRLALRKTESLLRAVMPSLVVVVNPLYTTRALAYARDSIGANFPIATVVTDPITPHRSWVSRRTPDIFCVSEEAAERVARFAPGVTPEVVDFPLSDAFTGPKRDKRAMRQLLRLHPEPFTALVAGGGSGTGRIEEIARSIATALPDVQLVVLTGRNGGLLRLLKSASWLPRISSVLPWIENPHEYFDAADVVISKAGPSTIHEVAARDTPLILTSEVGRQEYGNRRFAEIRGWGIAAETTSEVLSNLGRLLEGANLVTAERRAVGDGGAELAVRLRGLTAV